MRIKKFNENKQKDVLEQIMDIFNKHYGPESYDYVGEFRTWDDFIESQTSMFLTNMNNELNDNGLSYIKDYIDEDFIKDDITTEMEEKYVKIGFWIWDISGTHESPETFIDSVCYHDEDRKIIEDKYGFIPF